MALALVFIGCKDATEVEGTVTTNPAKAAAPGTPTVTSVETSGTGTAYYSHDYTVTWTAADDITGYSLFVRQNGKKAVQQLTGRLNPAADSWSASVTVSKSNTNIAEGASIQIGVRVSNGVNGSSDIVWSTATTF
jgi:hypothetical protein